MNKMNFLHHIDGFRRTWELNNSLKQVLYGNVPFVAMFHDIVYDGVPDNNYDVSIRDFKMFIDTFSDKGYQFVSFDTFYNNRLSSSKYCVLTFDDGFYSTYTLMNDYLLPRKLPFQIYVVSDWIGKDGYVNVNQIVEMNDENICTIGAHSKSHPVFRNINKEASMKEIIQCKSVIEDIISQDISEFAFPYGSMYACSEKDFKNARNAGFKYIYSTEPLYLKQKKDYQKQIIPRINGTEIIKKLRRI